MDPGTSLESIDELRLEIDRLKRELAARRGFASGEGDPEGDLARRLQNLEAIGALAGTIAHDFSNLFTSILGYSSILQVKAGDDKDIARAAEVITSAARKASDLTQQLVTLSRRSKLLSVPVDMNALVEEVAAQLAGRAGESVTVGCECGAGAASVTGDPHQLRQALLHLGSNACEAMGRGGSLLFRTANEHIDEAHLRTHPSATAGQHVAVYVSDDGPGIDAGVRDRVFDPFFSTKGGETHLGLGLATVCGIAKSHGGSLSLLEEGGTGETFRLLIPVEAG
jgi:two-component system cell cycle sensor histidine kinase/response regulator CckA